MTTNKEIEEAIEGFRKLSNPTTRKIYSLIPKKLTDIEEKLLVDTILFESLKAELKGRKEILKDVEKIINKYKAKWDNADVNAYYVDDMIFDIKKELKELGEK